MLISKGGERTPGDHQLGEVVGRTDTSSAVGQMRSIRWRENEEGRRDEEG